ncbi:MAG: aminotransferase class V-fold PLP-dependent enzyme [Pirellulaceae bacterium]|nr:aminotransferase class V-fold PLP-dependent enzyme [Pirellulaceae bacterium]
MLDEQSRRDDFPGLTGIHYLNTAAESIPPRSVGEALQAYWRDKQLGMQGRHAHFAAVEACREVASRMIGLATNEVSFCSCSSEAYNLLASALALKPDDEVVLNDLDFPAGATPWLATAEPPQTKLWKSRSGQLIIDDLVQLLSPKTALVQLSLISFYNGHRVDWDRVVAAVRQHAPQAILSLDVTQALGRVPVDVRAADIAISSTHKWTLGVHGGCVVGIPAASASRLTTQAGGWYHIENAFAADRFQRSNVKTGAASYSVGMPNFAALYALNAALRYVEGVGIDNIGKQADPLVATLDSDLRKLGLQPMCPLDPRLPTGIVAFQHERSDAIHAALLAEKTHVMHHAGRVRIAVHGYNTIDDIQTLITVLSQFA